jgi:Domain of unknown function (DUF4440)
MCHSTLKFALAAIGSVSSLHAAPPSDPDMLTASILAADTEFFDLYFNKCEPKKMATVVMPNVEFYHDKAGVIANDVKELVADYEKGCTEKLKPDAWRSRRQLESSSVQVYSVPGFGAIEEGYHRFFERQGDGPDKLVGRAKFAIVWKDDSGTWKPSRILSYAHRAAGAAESR